MLDEPGVPPPERCLKPGAVCSVMRNLHQEKGLSKNVRVVVQKVLRYSVIVEILPGDFDSSRVGTVFALPRINFKFRPSCGNFTVERRQFPQRLACAVTFNSCQGLTLDRIV